MKGVSMQWLINDLQTTKKNLEEFIERTQNDKTDGAQLCVLEWKDKVKEIDNAVEAIKTLPAVHPSKEYSTLRDKIGNKDDRSSSFEIKS